MVSVTHQHLLGTLRMQAVFEKARRLIREHDHDQPGQPGESLASSGGGAQGSGGININALAMNEASIKKLHIGGECKRLIGHDASLSIVWVQRLLLRA
jgi:hypothetical protein